MLNQAASGGVALALDYPSLEPARALADRTLGAVGMLKVGLELFLAAGADAVALGAHLGLPVFLDLKLHDIPETVERAVARASALGASRLTVHASGGPAMLRRATARAAKEGRGMTIVAVTVLTSFDEADLAAIGVRTPIAAQVTALARMAHAEGVRAFVCSPHEAAAVRDALGPDVELITPGVRVGGHDDDQKRVLTAHEAGAHGADWVVVGRPIRDASDPLATARAFQEQLAAGQRERAGSVRP